jgi:hypothetical protein
VCFDGYSIVGSFGHGSKVNQQFLSFDEQKERLAKPHQVWMVHMVALNHLCLLCAALRVF